jgi:hypothetical protein
MPISVDFSLLERDILSIFNYILFFGGVYCLEYPEDCGYMLLRNVISQLPINTSYPTIMYMLMFILEIKLLLYL